MSAPAEVSGTGVPQSYPVTYGFAGAHSATPGGLVPPATTDGSVSTDPTQAFTPGGAGTAGFTVTIPAGTVAARFALFDATADSDLDLYVFQGGSTVDGSAGYTAEERVDLRSPPAGTCTVWVHGYATADPSALTLRTWLVGGGEGNMTVSVPATGTVGAEGTIGLSFSTLAPATKYLGAVVYGGAAAGARPRWSRSTRRKRAGSLRRPDRRGAEKPT